ncbi:MAG: sugar/nucleoside kinase (ribokinase family) [Verrucomicrobiales bacterium]|jgi:sugar/nucleoside kinase (ribokinase family)
MSVIVAGPIALDTIETPTEKRDSVLGGAASYAAISASYFAPVHLIGAVGDDFPPAHLKIFKDRAIDTCGVDIIPGGRTFRWSGRYMENMNNRETIDIALNVLADHQPTVTDAHKQMRIALLANMAPQKQLEVLDQLHPDAFVVADSMDLWINSERPALLELLQRIDMLVINDSEAKLLAETDNLVSAGNHLRTLGPGTIAIKKGEHGALLFGENRFFSTVAYPLTHVIDPTGAGDSFVGGLIGFLSSLKKAGKDSLDFADLSRSIVYGTVMASFNCESFSADRLQSLEREEIDTRYHEFRSYTAF